MSLHPLPPKPAASGQTDGHSAGEPPTASIVTVINGDLEFFESMLERNFNNYYFWLQFGLKLGMSKDCPRRTLQAFKECARIDHNNPLPMMLAARLCLLELDDPHEGLQYALQAIDACKSEPCSSMLLSKSFLLAGIMHASIYEREPESVRRLQQHHSKTSLHYLELARKENNFDYLVHYHLALHHANQASIKQAIDCVKKGLELNPHHLPTIQLMLLCLSALKHHEEALRLCNAALHEFTDDIMLLYIKCNLEQSISDSGLEASLVTARHILRCARKQSQYLNGDYKLQHSHQTPASNNSKNSGHDSENQQQSPTKQVQITQGIFEPQPVIGSTNPTQLSELQVWLLIAEIYIKLGQLTDAESCISEGSNHVGGLLSHQIMYVKGLVYTAKRNYMEAKAMFQSCIALQPTHAKALQQLAYIHHLSGKNSSAERFLKDSLEVDHGLAETWHYLGLVLLAMGQASEASECCQNAIRLDSTTPVIPFSLINRSVLD